MKTKKLYAWKSDSEGGYTTCNESETLSDERSIYDEWDYTHYVYIGKFSTKEELMELLKRDREPDPEFWADILYKD